jgi:tetratricopeptide (TPR) repeat protein
MTLPPSLTRLSNSLRCTRLTLPLALLIATVCPSLGQTPFEEANALFKEKKYAEAEAAYERALVQKDTAAIHYNLGRVREALGDPAGAMLEWERALRLEPGHDPSRASLRNLRKATGTFHAGDLWTDRLRYPMVVNREIWIAAVGFWMFALGLWSGWASRLPRAGPLLACLGALIGSAGAYWKHQADIDPEMALTRDRSVTVRAAPADPARSLGELPAGTPIRVIGQSAGWHRCIIPGVGTGWIPAKSMERISSSKTP